MKRTSACSSLPACCSALVAAACGGDDDASAATRRRHDGGSHHDRGGDHGRTATTTTRRRNGDITVFAAASLTDSFNEIGEAFTAANPDAKATFSFDASSALVQQITQGAPADVFASADTANMDKLTTPGLNGTEPVIFATNLLDDHRRAGQPEGHHRRRRPGQARPQGRRCAPTGCPCGNYAKQILDSPAWR